MPHFGQGLVSLLSHLARHLFTAASAVLNEARAAERGAVIGLRLPF